MWSHLRQKSFSRQDDKVVVLVRFSVRIKAAGRDVGSDWAHVWAVKGGIRGWRLDFVVGLYDGLVTSNFNGAHQKQF
jgi:hypothetical protein